jgi:hypothetical protein
VTGVLARIHAVHLLHLWAIVWLAAALGRREDRYRLEVDPWGNVWAARVSSA